MEGILPLLLWGGLFVLMMRFGCGSHLFGHGHRARDNSKNEGPDAHAGGCCGGGHKRRADAKPAPERAPADAGPPEESVDPVCGKTIRTAEAKAAMHDGLVYFFCSRECREVFEAAPHLYLDDRGADGTARPLQVEHRPAGDSSHAR